MKKTNNERKNKVIDEEIIKHLPKSFRAFYKICKRAGLKIEKTGDENKNGND